MALWFCYLCGTGIAYSQLGFEVMALAEMSSLCRLRETTQRNEIIFDVGGAMARTVIAQW